MPKADPFRPTDDDARALAHRLIGQASHGALAVLSDGAPSVTRIALTAGNGVFTTLISDLAGHTNALRLAPEASLLIGEPGKGDPLAHPRMTLQVTARFIDKTDDNATAYLAGQPKAQLYIGFADFHLVRLTPNAALLNAGFGKAYRLTPADLLEKT
jgi:putative heme iron utilization protein